MSFRRAGGSMGSEKKYVDGYLAKTNILNVSTTDDDWTATEMNPRQVTAVYGCLPIPRQGTNYADRDGRRIMMKSIRIWGQIQWTPVAAIPALPPVLGPVRLIIVQDKNSCGGQLDGEQVIGVGLGSDGQKVVSSDNALMLPTNPDGWGRYVIKKQIIIVPPFDTSVAEGNSADFAARSMIVPFSMKVKLNTVVNFNASTGAIGSVVDNSFHLLAASSSPGPVTCTYYARTSFIG